MRFSKNWLQEWLDIKIVAEELSEQLTMAGLEVDGISPVAADFSNVLIGVVESIDKHPSTNKLNICKVDVGLSNCLTIVCQAGNAFQNMKVPVAMENAILANEVKVKKVEFHGIESQGIFCSTTELGLSDNAQTLFALPADAPVGMVVSDYLQLDDQIVNVDLTPNRGDCASVLGIAREVAALNFCKYKAPSIKSITPIIEDKLPITIHEKEACPRYVGRIIRRINSKASTPMWMQEYLRRSGLRSLNPVVDVTNYVLLELGQPMHAFDLAKLSTGIQVRFANAQEKLVLLNEKEVEFSAETLVIADEKHPIALAGIMGGLDSGVVGTTQDIFLESAFFNPINITYKSKEYGLQTDSSYRFERGVDFELQVKAIERATQLLLNIVGGEPGPICDICAEKYLPKEVEIKLNFANIARLLGISVPKSKVVVILETLGMVVSKIDESMWLVKVPSYRFDVKLEADLIEEIARVYGYNNIPITSRRTISGASMVKGNSVTLNRIRKLMQDRDYHEVINYSFIDADIQKLFDPDNIAIPLMNPIVNDMAVMRTNLWPGLLKTLAYNLHRQQKRVRIFETGLRFLQTNTKEIIQEAVLGGLAYGAVYPEQWGEANRLSDFYDVKADIEALLQLTNQFSKFEFIAAKHPVLHPGQAAEILKDNKSVGFLGILHPFIAQTMDIPNSVILFELNLKVLQGLVLPKYKPISKFPAIRRDIAIVVREDISVNIILNLINKVAGTLITDLKVFDLYHGENIEKNEKSVALGLTLQHPSRTLKDGEVNEIIEDVIAALHRQLNAKLRF